MFFSFLVLFLLGGVFSCEICVKTNGWGGTDDALHVFSLKCDWPPCDFDSPGVEFTSDNLDYIFYDDFEVGDEDCYDIDCSLAYDNKYFLCLTGDDGWYGQIKLHNYVEWSVWSLEFGLDNEECVMFDERFFIPVQEVYCTVGNIEDCKDTTFLPAGDPKSRNLHGQIVVFDIPGRGYTVDPNWYFVYRGDDGKQYLRSITRANRWRWVNIHHYLAYWKTNLIIEGTLTMGKPMIDFPIWRCPTTAMYLLDYMYPDQTNSNNQWVRHWIPNNYVFDWYEFSWGDVWNFPYSNYYYFSYCDNTHNPYSIPEGFSM